MFVKIYAWMWAAMAASALGFYAFGAFDMLTAVVFGFLCFGLTFMGMMCVLPSTVSHPITAEPAKAPSMSKQLSSPVSEVPIAVNFTGPRSKHA